MPGHSMTRTRNAKENTSKTRHKPHHTKLHSKNQKLLKQLEDAYTEISAIDDFATLNDLAIELGLSDEAELHLFETRCAAVFKKLQKLRTGTILSVPKSKDEERMEICHDFYVLRDPGTRLMLLTPVEVFKCNQSIVNKSFGLVRLKGQQMPLIYSFSGSSDLGFHTNAKIMDNTKWQKLAFHWGTFHKHSFKTNGYELYRGAPAGFDAASHAELKLMLFFACHILRQVLDEIPPLETQVGWLYKIKSRLKTAVCAEIILNRKPCTGCLKFQEEIEEMTGITFKFLLCPTLGRCILAAKNKKNELAFPLFAEGSLERMEDEPSSEPDSDVEAISTFPPRTQIQVVIPSSKTVEFTTRLSPKLNARHQATQPKKKKKDSLSQSPSHLPSKKDGASHRPAFLQKKPTPSYIAPEDPYTPPRAMSLVLSPPGTSLMSKFQYKDKPAQSQLHKEHSMKYQKPTVEIDSGSSESSDEEFHLTYYHRKKAEKEKTKANHHGMLSPEHVEGVFGSAALARSREMKQGSKRRRDEKHHQDKVGNREVGSPIYTNKKRRNL